MGFYKITILSTIDLSVISHLRYGLKIRVKKRVITLIKQFIHVLSVQNKDVLGSNLPVHVQEH